jgi:hypothetical protein
MESPSPAVFHFGWLALSPLLLLGALLGWFRPELLRALRPMSRGAAGEARVAKVLQRLFAEVLNDVILPDGRGGLTQIDHLALTSAGLLVVETKNYRGSIFGQTRERTWTQAIGHQRNRFQNPLYQNFAHTEAVKFHAPDVAVLERVVFMDLGYHAAHHLWSEPLAGVTGHNPRRHAVRPLRVPRLVDLSALIGALGLDRWWYPLLPGKISLVWRCQPKGVPWAGRGTKASSNVQQA